MIQMIVVRSADVIELQDFGWEAASSSDREMFEQPVLSLDESTNNISI